MAFFMQKIKNRNKGFYLSNFNITKTRCDNQVTTNLIPPHVLSEQEKIKMYEMTVQAKIL